jgi:Fic family protein
MTADLRRSPVGSLVQITGYDPRFKESYAVDAFVPHPLPQAVELDGAAWKAVMAATAHLARLDTAAGLIPNPKLVARVTMRREAVSTSALEGTYADLADVLAAEVVPEDDQVNDIPANVREVMNYVRAADMAYEWIAERPITIGFISDLQAEIVRDTDSDGPDAGNVRRTQVFIGAKHRRVTEARFVPPPPGHMLLDGYLQWLSWLTDPGVVESIPMVARIAMAHYQFETLHPYTDGNGRIGRLVAVLQMMHEDELRAPVLSVSTWLTERSDEYRDHLLRVSATGDWRPWISFFADAVAAEAKAGHDRIMQLLELRDDLVAAVKRVAPRGQLAMQIAGDLIAFPFLSVADAQRRHGYTNQANRNAISQLVELGLLEHYGDSRYARMYWNPQVYAIISG